LFVAAVSACLLATLLTGCGEGGEAGGIEPSIDDPVATPAAAPAGGGTTPPAVAPAGTTEPPAPAPAAQPAPDPGTGGGPSHALSAIEKHYTGKGPVVSREGIKLKLITTKQDCKLYEKPDRGSASSNAGLWKFFFVLPPDPEAPTRLMDALEERYGGYQTDTFFYRVADPRDESREAGWLHAEDVVEWHHRQVLRLRLRDTRSTPAFFWPDRETAIGAAKSGSAPPEGDAIAKEPNEGEIDLLLPLLHRDTVTVGRDKQDLYRVAFIGAPADYRGPPPGSLPSGSRAPPRTQKEAKERATADIVFVIDTTASMSHAINQVRLSVGQAARMVAQLPELQGRLRFGLVGYRDTLRGNPNLGYTARVMCTLSEGSDHAHFERVLANLETSKLGSIDYPEDVLCGLAHALARPIMGWNDVAHSLVILVGDASAKEIGHPMSRQNEPWPVELAGRSFDPEERTIGRILGIAQPGSDAVAKTGVAQIAFLSILIDHSASVTNEDARKILVEDKKVSERQYGELARGRTSGIQGRLIVVQGGERPSDFSRNLADLMKQQLEQMRQVLRSPGPVSLPAGSTAASAPIGFIQLLRSLPGGGAGEFKFARGYCTQFNNKNEEQFDPYFLVSRKALKKFLGGLNAFLEILESADRDTAQIVDGLQLISGMLAYDQKIDRDTKLRDILESELGLPVRNEVFRYTPSLLRSLPQGEYDTWLANVKRVRDGLNAVVENQNKWHALTRDSGYGFVAVQELP
jgi:hypothetical protein